ncbi:MAG: succinylglutamate desuccinylase/aspartoacylase family protein [Deltaproteobacteria bacterium]|nr:succinylglutamate desuccinylase/aspartoacylase family protein [Deltaproteobacteria bacterium]
MNKRNISAIFMLVFAVVVCIACAHSYMSMWKPDVVVPGPGVTEKKMLSDYCDKMKGSPGDTPVYILKGKSPGATVFIFGGTHADEPSGVLSAMVMVENMRVEKGRVIMVTHANESGFTQNYPQEAHPQKITFETPQGPRTVRFGSRTSNSIHHWPDPEVYTHFPSGQQYSGDEIRNPNRAFPGRPNGSYQQQVAWAYQQLILKEKVDLVIDLHEAPPEYPFINAIGAHERGKEIAVMTSVMLQDQGIEIGLELSPSAFRGLTYRELGDTTPAICMLMETANPAQSRLRGITDESLVVDGKDSFLVQANKLGRTYVPVSKDGWPLKLRVARHVTAMNMIFSVFTEFMPDKQIVVRNLPSYDDLRIKGIGQYLNPIPAKNN